MIKKRNEPKNLRNLIRNATDDIIIDRTPTSADYFNVSFLPNQLVAGKNVIKILGTPQLIKTTEIQFEILDANNEPIFYEVLNYLGSDGSRAIVVYIYPDTPAGPARLILAGRTSTDFRNGRVREIPISNNPTDSNYFKNINVLWTTTIRVNPTAENTSEIIYLSTPKVTIKEVIQTYKDTSTSIDTRKSIVSASADNRINARSTNLLPPANSGLESSTRYTPSTGLNTIKEGQFKPVPTVSNTTTFAADTVLSEDRSTAVSGEIIRIDNKSLLPRISTTKPFFEKDMIGGTLTVNNIDTASLLPRDVRVRNLGQLIDGEYVLSNSYNTTIVDVINSTTAIVSNPFNYYYSIPIQLTPGRFSVVDQSVNQFINEAEFTASFLRRVEAINETQSSQSYADITIGNLEPASGDVYKIQTFYKPYGAFGNFTDAGFSVIENTSILNDDSVLISDVLLGQKELHKGEFDNQNIIDNYWQLTNYNLSGVQLPTMLATQDRLINGLTITTGSALVVNDVLSTAPDTSAATVNLQQTVPVLPDTVYKLIFRATGTNSQTFKTSQYPNATIDIYISGSNIEPDNTDIVTDRNAVVRSKRFIGNKNLGTYLGTIDNQGIYLDKTYEFKSNAAGNITPIFVVRSGEWTLGSIDIRADKESGFTPNYTNFKVRIPSVYLDTELVFIFKYFNSDNTPAPIESTVAGVIFKGNNTYIAGEGNLLTGSIYIGTEVGSGIEMSGVSSGYILSVGYKGFTSASLGKAPGGFIIWSGSDALNVGVDKYTDIGMELVGANDNAHLIFNTSGSGKLDIKAETFFIGTTGSQYISGSAGQIEISSSLFFLDPSTGTLRVTGDINANTGYFKDIDIIGTLYKTRHGSDVTSYSLSPSNNQIETWILPTDAQRKTWLEEAYIHGSSSFAAADNTYTTVRCTSIDDPLTESIDFIITYSSDPNVNDTIILDKSTVWASRLSQFFPPADDPTDNILSLITSSLTYPLLSHGYISSSNLIVSGTRVRTGLATVSGSSKGARIVDIEDAGSDWLIRSDIPFLPNPTGIFFTVAITGSADGDFTGSIDGTLLPYGRYNWKISGSEWMSDVSTSTPTIQYYKDYDTFPDYRPGTRFQRWHEDVGTFSDYDFSASFDINGDIVQPFSGFIFLSSSYAIVSQSIYAVTTSPTQERVVSYTRPINAGDTTFTGTLSTNQYGTVLIGNDSNATHTNAFTNSTSLANPDSIESDWIDITNIINTNDSTDGIKLQFAMRMVDNQDDEVDVTCYDFADPYRYQTYGGARNLGFNAIVIFYGEDLDTGVPRELTRRNISIDDGTFSQDTYTWYVFDEFIDVLLRYPINSAVAERIKIKIEWYTRIKELFPSTINGVSLAPSLGRFNGIAISELRLLRAARARALSVTDLKINNTSVATDDNGRAIVFNADSILPRIGKTAGASDEGSTSLGSITRGFSESYINGIIPTVNGAYNLGSDAKRWNTIFAINVLNTSDRSMKTQVHVSDLGLKFINALTPVSYVWKNVQIDDKKHYGLIAQDVRDVLHSYDIYDASIVNESGTALAYLELIAPLIKAIQELDIKVERLQNQLTAFKKQ